MVQKQEEGWLPVPAAAEHSHSQHTPLSSGLDSLPRDEELHWEVGEQV